VEKKHDQAPVLSHTLMERLKSWYNVKYIIGTSDIRQDDMVRESTRSIKVP